MECLSVAKMIDDEPHRKKVVARLNFLKEKLENYEFVDLSLEAKMYAKENGITPSPSIAQDSQIQREMVAKAPSSICSMGQRPSPIQSNYQSTHPDE